MWLVSAFSLVSRTPCLSNLITSGVLDQKKKIQRANSLFITVHVGVLFILLGFCLVSKVWTLMSEESFGSVQLMSCG